MKQTSFLLILSVLLCGCASQVPTGEREMTPEEFVSAIRTSAEAALSAKLVASIAAGDSGLFPLRAQGVSLAMLAFKAEKGSWPKDKDELGAFLIERFSEGAPSRDDLNELKIVGLSGGGAVFAFGASGTTASGYHLSHDGTISFPLPSPRPKSNLPPEPIGIPPSSRHPFPWDQLIAKLVFEVLFSPRK
jgi:hypothetical protein